MPIDLEEYGKLKQRVDTLWTDCYEGEEPVVKTWRGYMAVQAERDKQMNKNIALAGVFVVLLVGVLEWRPWHKDPAPTPTPAPAVQQAPAPSSYDPARHQRS